ncbi:MAG: hypothetical protein U0V87_10930 [Acidobacteriota bacterium]
MKENAEELHARRVLEAHAFKVDRISREPGARRADYRIRAGVEETILEVTDKKETQFILDLHAEAATNRLATADREVMYWNGIDRVIKEKTEQLRQTPGQPDAFRVLWLSALHGDGDFIMNVGTRTAYGLQDLLVQTSREMPYAKPCFYYNRNTFYAVPELDGIILVNQTGGQLCINGFSPRCNLFRGTALARVFPPNTVLDPEVWERDGRAFILDGEMDRTDPKAKWRRIFEKYGAKTTAFNMSQFVGLVSIPEDARD